MISAKPRRHGNIIQITADSQLLLMKGDSVDVHCLNPVAAAVWGACDGTHDPAAIAAMLAGRIASGTLGADYGADEAAAITETTLAQLAQLGLVDDMPLAGRRRFLVKAGRNAAFAALVASTMIPTAASASSCPEFRPNDGKTRAC